MGCRGANDADGALDLKGRLEAARAARQKPPVSVEGLRILDGLRQALTMDGHRLRTRLRGLNFEHKLTMDTFIDGTRQAGLVSQREIRIDQTGQFWVREDANWHTEDARGREGRGCGAVAGAYYTETIGRQITQVPVHDAEPDRCLVSGFEGLDGLLLPALDAMEYTVESATWRGRPAGRVVLGTVRKSASQKAPMGPVTDQKKTPTAQISLFERHAQPIQAQGEFTVLVGSGAVVAADVTLLFEVKKRSKTAELRVSLSLNGESYAAKVPAPERFERYRPRRREYHSHQQLLDAIGVKAGDEAGVLPAPGDAPKLTLSAAEQGENPEDAPPKDPTQDEDTPR